MSPFGGFLSYLCHMLQFTFGPQEVEKCKATASNGAAAMLHFWTKILLIKANERFQTLEEEMH